MRRPLIVAALGLWILLLGAPPALAAEPVVAYLDPATSSMIISAILGGFAAIALVIKRFWFQITRPFVSTKDEPAGTIAEIDETPSTPAAD